MIGYCANELKTIGKAEFEVEGVSTCAHQWNTTNIRKQKTAGMLHAEKNPHYCGAPPLLGEDLSSLNPPILSTNKKVTGPTTNVLRKENCQKRKRRQEEQGPQSYWSTHKGKSVFPAELPPPGKHRNNMCLSGLEVHHPTYETLLKYATGGCPIKTGRYWNKEEIHVAVIRVPHESALADDTIAHFTAEAKGKVASKRASLVLYYDIKGNIPKQMKVSPISAIPHKLKAFRLILDI